MQVCIHRGESTGERVICQSCPGRVERRLFACGIYGQCTQGMSVPGFACCRSCTDYSPKVATVNKFCDCTNDGFCPRYRREMGGRMRELCAGVNVDLGTAAVFREQWRREAPTKSDSGQTTAPTPLLLQTDQAPGDTVAMTAAIYSLHRAHPGRYLTAVESPYPEVFEHNPNIAFVSDGSPLRMHYPAIHQSNQRGIHFMQGWCEFLGMALDINVPLLTNRPHLYFADPTPLAPVCKDHWLICSGGKRDFTNKLWGHHNYQAVVYELAGRIFFTQVGGDRNDHPHLISTYDDMVGKTSLRQLFKLVQQSQGVVCGVSLLMHVAAALEKPAIVIAGGREPVQWNAYPKQQYLHTVGALPCSSTQGDVGAACWRSRTVPLGDGTGLDKDTCLRPVGGTPECMTMISPARVAELVFMYNKQYEVTPCAQ